jgi:hypothetical protein
MSIDPIIAALGLPANTRVDQRVPKKLLLDQGLPTAADKRQVQDNIEEVQWIAALKPTTIGVADYRDEVRTYLEIAVLGLTLRPDAKAARIVALLHRAIPYPLLLITEQQGSVSLSLAHTRASQAEHNKWVIDEVIATAPFSPEEPDPSAADFLESLALAQQHAPHLLALYQGWIDRVEALAAARITGSYMPPGNAETAEARRAALTERAALLRELATLRAQARTEKQMNRAVDLNLAAKRIEARLTTLNTHL